MHAELNCNTVANHRMGTVSVLALDIGSEDDIVYATSVR